MPMNMKVSRADIDGPLILDPEFFQDERGFFFESYTKRRFAEHGLDIDFVQDNHSRSGRNVLRGFHFQDATVPQWRLVRCTVGRIWDCVVDLRVSSPTFGKWFGLELDADSKRQFLIPPEFAHGFCVLSDVAEVQYKCSNHHTPAAEHTLAWNDPAVGVRWPVTDPQLSARDKDTGKPLSHFRDRPLFR
jgi:dTDP-4-dehydrorhamnose 3,5-epimerase